MELLLRIHGLPPLDVFWRKNTAGHQQARMFLQRQEKVRSEPWSSGEQHLLSSLCAHVPVCVCPNILQYASRSVCECSHEFMHLFT